LYSKKGGTVSIAFKKDELNLEHFIEVSRDSLVGDWPLEILLLSKKQKGYFMAESMAMYRFHDGGITSYRIKSKEDFLADRLMVCKRMRKYTDQKRVLNFFIGEIYLHLFLYKEKARWLCMIKGFTLILANIHFKKIDNSNTNLSFRHFLSLLFKRTTR
jgi:hypothetical protein